MKINEAYPLTRKGFVRGDVSETVYFFFPTAFFGVAGFFFAILFTFFLATAIMSSLRAKTISKGGNLPKI
jgi:hypothetical protein